MTAETRLSPARRRSPHGAKSTQAATIALDLACRAKRRGGAATIEAIVAKGEPIYGINTGFGKLASARIEHG